MDFGRALPWPFSSLTMANKTIFFSSIDGSDCYCTAAMKPFTLASFSGFKTTEDQMLKRFWDLTWQFLLVFHSSSLPMSDQDWKWKCWKTILTYYLLSTDTVLGVKRPSEIPQKRLLLRYFKPNQKEKLLEVSQEYPVFARLPGQFWRSKMVRQSGWNPNECSNIGSLAKPKRTSES